MNNTQLPKCPYCDSIQLRENDQGNEYCQDCGKVIVETKFSNNVTFANLKMTGHVVDINEKNNKASSEKRIKRARDKINQLKRLLNIEYEYQQAVDAAVRVIKYANDHNFFDKGRNVQMYAAAALYITLRFKKAPYLLIDFSDKLNVNLFKLGRCFLKLSRFLGFQDQLPLIDPSLFIHRYCRLLNLGQKTKQITMTAIRLVQRMKRDWICQGRRPSSLCGAAILIATKIHDVKCSTNEICKTVFVCDETIRRRLEQFKQTNVAKLTKQEFERLEDNLDQIEGQMDPPAFTKARMKSQQQKLKLQMSKIQAAKLVQAKKQRQKIQWSNFKNNLDVPQEILNGEVQEVQKGFCVAKEKYADSIEEQSSSLRSITQDQIFDDDESQSMNNEQNSQIKQQQVNKFILTEDEQKVKQNLWKKINKAWLQKQQAKKQKAQKAPRRKIKKINQMKNQDPFHAIKNTKLGENINDEQLKKLLGSQPKPPAPPLKLNKIFDAFEWKI